MKKAGKIGVLALGIFLVLALVFVFSFSVSFVSAIGIGTCGDGNYESATENCDFGSQSLGYWDAGGRKLCWDRRGF